MGYQKANLLHCIILYQYIKRVWHTFVPLLWLCQRDWMYIIPLWMYIIPLLLPVLEQQVFLCSPLCSGERLLVKGRGSSSVAPFKLILSHQGTSLPYHAGSCGPLLCPWFQCEPRDKMAIVVFYVSIFGWRSHIKEGASERIRRFWERGSLTMKDGNSWARQGRQPQVRVGVKILAATSRARAQSCTRDLCQLRKHQHRVVCTCLRLQLHWIIKVWKWRLKTIINKSKHHSSPFLPTGDGCLYI